MEEYYNIGQAVAGIAKIFYFFRINNAGSRNACYYRQL